MCGKPKKIVYKREPSRRSEEEGRKKKGREMKGIRTSKRRGRFLCLGCVEVLKNQRKESSVREKKESRGNKIWQQNQWCQ